VSRERRRDRWLRTAGLVLACAILGPPFFVVCYLAVSGLNASHTQEHP